MSENLCSPLSPNDLDHVVGGAQTSTSSRIPIATVQGVDSNKELRKKRIQKTIRSLGKPSSPFKRHGKDFKLKNLNKFKEETK